MKYFLQVTIFLLLTLITFEAQSEESPVVDIPPGDDVIVSIEKGKPAPFSGQLFSTDTALRWGFWLKQYDHRLMFDVSTARQICEARVDFEQDKFQIQYEKNDKVLTQYKDLLLQSETENAKLTEELNNPPWYKTVTFGAVLGGVITAGVVALAVWAVSASGE